MRPPPSPPSPPSPQPPTPKRHKRWEEQTRGREVGAARALDLIGLVTTEDETCDGDDEDEDEPLARAKRRAVETQPAEEMEPSQQLPQMELSDEEENITHPPPLPVPPPPISDEEEDDHRRPGLSRGKKK